MYYIEWLKLHCASKMWDMACEKITNCTQLQEKCMSLIALILPDRILTEDFLFVCYHHPEVIRKIRMLALKNTE
uniref:Uncharacterized protein n=1 Tax=Setaria italica TaxID=4555 RepID=K3YMX7_SETIT